MIVYTNIITRIALTRIIQKNDLFGDLFRYGLFPLLLSQITTPFKMLIICEETMGTPMGSIHFTKDDSSG
jgi:hypothetical protein